MTDATLIPICIPVDRLCLILQNIGRSGYWMRAYRAQFDEERQALTIENKNGDGVENNVPAVRMEVTVHTLAEALKRAASGAANKHPNDDTVQLASRVLFGLLRARNPGVDSGDADQILQIAIFDFIAYG